MLWGRERDKDGFTGREDQVISRKGISLLFVLSMLAACNTQQRWTYPFQPDRLYQSPQKHDLVIAVIPFEEKRPVENDGSGIFIAMIPLVPYGTSVFNRPEAAAQPGLAYDFKMADDLARAAADS